MNKIIKDRTEYSKQYYLKNKLKIKEQNAVKYNLEKNHLKKKTAEYYANNKEARKEWNVKNKEKLTAYFKQHYTENQGKKKDYNYKRNYKISIEDYRSLFELQQGFCAGCKKHQTEIRRKLAVDHCHTTGKIRGLLCHNCNSSLGFAYDNSDTLINLANYIKINNE